MNKLYVIDTVTLISYYSHIFEQSPKISPNSIELIDSVFLGESNIRLSIPSVVFIEIFEKWYKIEELAAKIRYEIFEVIKNNPFIEIKPIEREVLENFILLEDDIINLENHDRLILASAMMLNCPLITNDPKIISYVNKYKVIPGIIN